VADLWFCAACQVVRNAKTQQDGKWKRGVLGFRIQKGAIQNYFFMNMLMAFEITARMNLQIVILKRDVS